MAKRLYILPYKLGSRSAKGLAQGLSNKLGRKVLRIRPNGKYRYRDSHIILNWGCSNSIFPEGNFLNKTGAIAKASNKLLAFQEFQKAGVSTVEWTTDKEVAKQWLAKGSIVFSRTRLSAHSGVGIVVNQPSNGTVADAPLYTRYKKKIKEYRVHVMGGKVVDIAEKRKKAGQAAEAEGLVRNHAHGWVFCRQNVEKKGNVDQLAVAACQALGLDFGAVDIIYNGRDDKCYVLEVNTAPGLEGATLTSYVEGIYATWKPNLR